MILSSYPASCNSFRTRAVDPGSGDLREEEACRSTWSCTPRGACLFLRYRPQPKTNGLLRNSGVRFAGNGHFLNRSFNSIVPACPNCTCNSNRSQPFRYGCTRNTMKRRRNAAVLKYSSSSSAENLSSTILFYTAIIQLESSWNGMAHSDAREGRWSGNWRMEWIASTLHTSS
jgi:hypothetical protein